jgi:hypothetical protein
MLVGTVPRVQVAPGRLSVTVTPVRATELGLCSVTVPVTVQAESLLVGVAVTV